MCFDKAGDICRESGYDILVAASDSGSFIAGQSSGDSGAITGAESVSRSLLIACREDS